MNKILVFGDSIAYGKWDALGGWVARVRQKIDEKYNLGVGGNVQVYNLGIPGEVAIRLVERLEAELKYRIDQLEDNLVLLAIGINDSCPNNWMTGAQTSESEFKAAIRKCVTISKSYKCESAIVGLTPVSPEKSKNLQFTNDEVKKYDNYLSDVAEELDVPKIELFSELQKAGFADLLVDSVHPGDEGHKLLSEKIFKYIKKVL